MSASDLTAPAVAADPAVASNSKAARAAAAKASSSAKTTSPASGAQKTGGVSSAGGAPGAVTASGTVVYGFSDPLLLSQSASVQVQQLEQMKALGVTSVRMDVGWNWVQNTGPDTYDWTAIDQGIASLRQVGLSADLIIDQCPPWAAVSSAQGSVWAQPASAAAFAKFAAAVAARYGPKGVDYFEIWNEPNIDRFWQPKPDPAAYTADLKAAYAAIKEVDPSAMVLSGGLAPDADTATTVDPRTFLADMYADGAKGSFDGVGDHPYSYPTPPDDVESWSGWSKMAETSPSLRSIMVENGDSAKKIWVTEYGAPTSGPDSVGDAGQSTELAQAMSQVSKLSWIGSFYIYTWADASDQSAEDDGFGLLAGDNSQKPAYATVAAALAAG